MPSPLLLLGLGGTAEYREFPLARIAAGYPVILANGTAPAWARPYLAGHLAVDPGDAAATTAVVREYAAVHDVSGVLTCESEHLVTAARLAGQLGLRGGPVGSQAVCVDRLEVRRRLEDGMVPVPRWAAAPDPEAAARHGLLLGYPVVIKSRTGGGRTGLARERGEVPAVCARVAHPGTAWPYPPGGLLVEELPEGQRVSAETVVEDGDVRIVAVTRTVLGPAPAREPVRHCVYAHDTLLHNRLLRQTAARAVDALGVTLGTLHIELALTSRGPYVTDVTALLAEDVIPLLVERATGIDLPQVAADLAVGRAPDLTPTRQRAAAVHFAHPAVTGRPAHRVVTGATAVDCHAALDRLAPGPTVGIASSAAARV
ncbi:acetyl-CoA carboxylase biotin carboxylase subunit family protein [Streptomyces sp. NPDC048182]|uniref:ATP-grasp domain-containing protein n=1 Tax=Streptomyces sp. NPDC048182 TaxID=3365507 RepID=UPI003717B920